MKFTPLVIVLAMVLLAGCRDQSTGPSTEAFNAERDAVAAKAKAKAKGKAKNGNVARTVGAKTGGEDVPGAVFGNVDEDFAYDPTGKRDPFRSFEWERLGQMEEDAELRGPLEQFDVSQLSLLAIVWNTGNARALVQDPSGTSYIIGAGTRIGKNAGRVTRIEDNLVVVRETYVDYLGEETTKDVEMRIRRSEGG